MHVAKDKMLALMSFAHFTDLSTQHLVVPTHVPESSTSGHLRALPLVNNYFAGVSMLESAQATHANIGTFASPALESIPSKSVGLKRKANPSNSDLAMHWERPR